MRGLTVYAGGCLAEGGNFLGVSCPRYTLQYDLTLLPIWQFIVARGTFCHQRPTLAPP